MTISEYKEVERIVNELSEKSLDLKEQYYEGEDPHEIADDLFYAIAEALNDLDDLMTGINKQENPNE